MDSISRYDKKKIELGFVKKIPASALPEIIFQTGFTNNNILPTEVYILDEENFKQYMKPEYETADFYYHLYSSYYRDNTELLNECGQLLSNETVYEEKNKPFASLNTEYEKNGVISQKFSILFGNDKTLNKIMETADNSFLLELLMVNLYEEKHKNIELTLFWDNKLKKKSVADLEFCKILAALAKEKNKRLISDIERLRLILLQMDSKVKTK